MKKLLFLVIVLIFVGCSNTQVSNNQKNSISLCEKYCNNWELENLEYEISKIKLYDSELANDLNNCLLEKKRNKIQLENLLQEMKFSIETHQLDGIEKNFKNTIANRELIKRLKLYNDYYSFNVVIGKIKFYKNTASNMVGLICLEQVIYLSLDYELVDNKWRIKRWKEKNS